MKTGSLFLFFTLLAILGYGQTIVVVQPGLPTGGIVISDQSGQPTVTVQASGNGPPQVIGSGTSSFVLPGSVGGNSGSSGGNGAVIQGIFIPGPEAPSEASTPTPSASTEEPNTPKASTSKKTTPPPTEATTTRKSSKNKDEWEDVAIIAGATVAVVAIGWFVYKKWFKKDDTARIDARMEHDMAVATFNDSLSLQLSHELLEQKQGNINDLTDDQLENFKLSVRYAF